MNTQKVAITMPKNLIAIIDNLSKQNNISRSKLISNIVQEKILEDKKKEIKMAYDNIFSDEDIAKEQINTSKWFEQAGSSKGQEW